MYDFSFYFESISFSKKHPYTLIFKGFCTNANGRQVIIKYTGAEIFNDSSVVIPEDILEQLHDELRENFNYGPFDAKVAKVKLKEKNSFYFNFK